MKDLNILTILLFGAGLVCIGDAIFFADLQHNLVFLLSACAVIAVLDTFPIQLPNGISYNAGVIGFMYLMLSNDLPAAQLGMLVGTLASFIRHGHRLFSPNAWFRMVCTLGMYTVCAFISCQVYSWFTGLPLFVDVLLTVACFEIVNVLILQLIYKTTSTLARPITRKWVQTLYLPVLIFSAVLTRALTLSGWDLYFEVSCDLFFLAVIYIFSVQYRNLANRYRESEKKYRLIAENTLDVILTLDTDGRVTYASPSHETVMGWSGDALVGTPLTSVVHPDDRVSVQDHLRMAREQLTPFQIQFNYRRDTAGWVLVEGAGSPMLDTEGDMDGLVLVLRDITDRVETEELLRKSDKLAVVGQLAAGVAHELRNPLTAVKGFLQLLKRRQASESEYIGIMLDELKRIELIIGEFLILAKPHAVQFQRKNPEALLQSVVALLDAQAILNNVQIRIEADRPLPDVLCEENQLKQVFINILKNAIEAMPHGGDIDIQAVTTPTGEVVLRFIDHGVGIAESHLPRLGEPFYTTKESGTGLGLMISYRIVQAHKGQMSIQSQLHQGTTVEIRLPGVS